MAEVAGMTATVVLVGLAVGTYCLKAAVPLLLGGRELPDQVARLSELLPAALLAALVLVSTLGKDGGLSVDARIVGLGAAAVALSRRAPFVVAVGVAAAATTLVRLV
jgi:branched-subunit amino acid transport protein